MLKDGFAAKEIAEAKSGWLQSRQVGARPGRRRSRARSRLTSTSKRTLAWDADFEKKVEALTGEQILAAMRKHLDPAKMTIVKAGDFAKGTVRREPSDGFARGSQRRGPLLADALRSLAPLHGMH